MLQIEKKHLEILHSILGKYPYKFYAYGSRAKKNAQEFSDLDLCYQENVPSNTIAEINGELAESYLPFVVELVAGKNMRPAFQKAIEKDLILVSAPNFNPLQKLV